MPVYSCDLMLRLDREMWLPGDTLSGAVRVTVVDAKAFTKCLKAHPLLRLKVYGKEKGIFKTTPGAAMRRYFYHDKMKYFKQEVELPMLAAYERHLERGMERTWQASSSGGGGGSSSSSTPASTVYVPALLSSTTTTRVTFELPFSVPLPTTLPPSSCCDATFTSCSLHYRVDIRRWEGALATSNINGNTTTTAGGGSPISGPKTVRRKDPFDFHSRLFYVVSAVRVEEITWAQQHPRMVPPTEPPCIYRSLADRARRSLAKLEDDEEGGCHLMRSGAVTCEVCVRPWILALQEGHLENATSTTSAVVVAASGGGGGGGGSDRRNARPLSEPPQPTAGYEGEARSAVLPGSNSSSGQFSSTSASSEANSSSRRNGIGSSGKATPAPAAAEEEEMGVGDDGLPTTVAHRPAAAVAAAAMAAGRGVVDRGGGDGDKNDDDLPLGVKGIYTTDYCRSSPRFPLMASTPLPPTKPLTRSLTVRVGLKNVSRQRPIAGVRVRLQQLQDAMLSRVPRREHRTLAFSDYYFVSPTTKTAEEDEATTTATVSPTLSMPAGGGATASPTKRDPRGLLPGHTIVFDVTLELPPMTRLSEDFSDAVPLPTVQTRLLSSETAIEVLVFQEREDGTEGTAGATFYFDPDIERCRLFFGAGAVHVAAAIDRRSVVPLLPQFYLEKIRPDKVNMQL